MEQLRHYLQCVNLFQLEISQADFHATWLLCLSVNDCLKIMQDPLLNFLHHSFSDTLFMFLRHDYWSK